MNLIKMLNLQLFAGEGAGAAGGSGEGGGEGASTGAISAVAEQNQRLRELGVPEEKLRKRAQKASVKVPEGAIRTAPKAQTEAKEAQAAAAATTQTEETQSTTKSRMSWDEIMADPEYNKEMQAVVQSRLKSSKAAEETLGKITPALEVLARKHGLDVNNIDYEALNKAISDDNAFYEQKALELGVSVDTAKKIDQKERDDVRTQREEAKTLEEQKIRNHFMSLEQQTEALRATFPNIDLRTELQNPVFARMTSPSGGVSVADAYYAVHRKEIMNNAIQASAQQTAQKISNSIRAGQTRPDENGTIGQAPSVTTFDYSKASKAERDAIKKRIREASARGEKLYPGR